MQGPVHWYIHDPQLRRELGGNLSTSSSAARGCHPADPDWDQKVCNSLVRSLSEIFLQVEWKEESREIAAVIHRVDPEVTVGPCTVVFWWRTELAPQGFIQDFFLGGRHLCAGKLISCGHRPQTPGGVWGHAPPEKFWNFKPSESDF